MNRPLWWLRFRCWLDGHSPKLSASRDWKDEEGFPRWRREYVCRRGCGKVWVDTDHLTAIEEVSLIYDLIYDLGEPGR